MVADISKTSTGCLHYIEEDVEVFTVHDLKEIYEKYGKHPLIISFGDKGLDIEVYDDCRE